MTGLSRHHSHSTRQPHLVALKDREFRYRICSVDYAHAMRLTAPANIVDRNDFDLLPRKAAELIRQSDELVRDSLEPAFIDGGVLSPGLGGQYVCTQPMLAQNGVLAGLEVQIIDLALLPAAQQSIFTSLVQLRELSSQAPWGILVHRNHRTLYVNQSWLQLHTRTGPPTAAQLRQWLGGNNTDAHRSGSYRLADGQALEYRSTAVRWNGLSATAVFVSAAPAALPAVTGAAPQTPSPALGFIEKRRGPRRQRASSAGAVDPLQPGAPSDENGLFDALPNPMLICDGWQLLYANPVARRLLAATAVAADAVGQLFNDRDRANIQAGMENRGHLTKPLHLSVELDNTGYNVTVSMLEWNNQLTTLFSLQPLPAVAKQLDEVQTNLARLEDFALAAADFLVEIDAQLTITEFRALSRRTVAVEQLALPGASLPDIAKRLAVPDDYTIWQELIADLNRHQVLRDRELKWQHPDSRMAVIRISALPVFDDDGQFQGYRGSGRDITRDYEDSVDVAYHASHDALTGLVNRREFEKRCEAAVASARSGNATHGLCFIDLDNFKTVNDTCGHLAGDELLRQLSAMFTGLVRKSDVLARLGGDEFGVLIFDVGLNEALRLANQIRAEVESFQFLCEGNRFTVGASIGLVIIDEGWKTRSAVFGAADSACYDAKNQGRNRVAVFQRDADTNPSQSGERPWVEMIGSALQDKRFRLAMQEIKPLGDDIQPGRYMELLMRMSTPTGELVNPRSFLPAVERYGLAHRVDHAVIDTALKWLSAQPHMIESLQMCAINLTGQSFSDENFKRQLLKKLANAKFDVSKLCFEVTETATIANLTVASRFMQEVGELGCHFSLDDFGSGLSSFAYLKNLPVTYLKIDGLFVKDILEDPIDFAMVKAINDIGQTLGKRTVAEYVESEAVLDKLVEMGVDFAQGYHIGKPTLIDNR